MFIMFNTLGQVDGNKEILAKADTLEELKEVLAEKGYINKKFPKVYDSLWQELVSWDKIEIDRLITFDVPIPWQFGYYHLAKI